MEEGKKRRLINGESQAERNKRLGLTSALASMGPSDRKRHMNAASVWQEGERHHIDRAPHLDEIDNDWS